MKLCGTMGKFDNFLLLRLYVKSILKSSKTAIFAVSEDLNFIDFVDFSFQQLPKSRKSNFRASKISNVAISDTSGITKIDFT